MCQRRIPSKNEIQEFFGLGGWKIIYKQIQNEIPIQLRIRWSGHEGPLVSFIFAGKMEWDESQTGVTESTAHYRTPFSFFFPFSLSSFPLHFFYSFPCVCRHSVLARFLLSEKQNDDGRGDKQQDPDYIDGHKTTTTTTTGELLTTDLRARLARLIDFSVRDGQRGPGHWPSSSPSVVWPLCCL